MFFGHQGAFVEFSVNGFHCVYFVRRRAVVVVDYAIKVCEHCCYVMPPFDTLDFCVEFACKFCHALSHFSLFSSITPLGVEKRPLRIFHTLTAS